MVGLSRIEIGGSGADARVAPWIRKQLLTSLARVPQATPDENEDRLLAAMAGVVDDGEGLRVVEWEGRQYRVSAARGEMQRLRRVRQRQRGLSLTAALERADKPGAEGEQALADTLASIVYAAHLGDPDGPALATSNIAPQHDFGHNLFSGARGAWKLPNGRTERGPAGGSPARCSASTSRSRGWRCGGWTPRIFRRSRGWSRPSGTPRR